MVAPLSASCGFVDKADKALHSNAERDSFIEAFWKARNPTARPDNPYKEERYRRLQYANEHYGLARARNGWRTDRGRI